MLEAQNLTYNYPRQRGLLPVLREVELNLPPGQLQVVYGPSGCGKSTLLLALGGLSAPTKGKVRFSGEDIYSCPPSRIRRLRNVSIRVAFQQCLLIPYLSAEQNVAMGGSCQGTAQSGADDLLDELGLADRRDHLPDALSAGEQQRVALARALVVQPKLLLADEPTSCLDQARTEQVYQLLRTRCDLGMGVFVAAHDAAARSYADRVYELREGQLHDAT